MNHKTEKDYQHKMITIPNALSLFRLVLIPVFLWLYCGRKEYLWSAFVLFLSGVTDVLDGWIARQFHMISDFGKALDPVADKLTQAAVLLSLVTRFPLMAVLLVLFVLKECIVGVSGLVIIHKTRKVYGADWHGKVNTCLLYLMVTLHIIWYDIPAIISDILLCICFIMMTISLVLYCIRNIGILKNQKSDIVG